MRSARVRTVVLVFSLGSLAVSSSLETSVARETQVDPDRLEVVIAPVHYHWPARFCLGGRMIVTADRWRRTRVWDTATGQPILELREKPLEWYDVSHSGEELLGLSRQGRFTLWSARSGAVIQSFDAGSGPPPSHRDSAVRLGWGRRIWRLDRQGRLYVRERSPNQGWRLFLSGVRQFSASQEYPHVATISGSTSRSTLSVFDLRRRDPLWKTPVANPEGLDWSRRQPVLAVFERPFLTWRGARSPRVVRRLEVTLVEGTQTGNTLVHNGAVLVGSRGSSESVVYIPEGGGKSDVRYLPEVAYDQDLSPDGKWALITGHSGLPAHLLDLTERTPPRNIGSALRSALEVQAAGTAILLGMSVASLNTKATITPAEPEGKGIGFRRLELFRLMDVRTGRLIDLPSQLNAPEVMGAALVGGGRFVLSQGQGVDSRYWPQTQIGRDGFVPSPPFLWDLQAGKQIPITGATWVGNDDTRFEGVFSWWRGVIPIGDHRAAILDGGDVYVLELSSGRVIRRIEIGPPCSLVGADGAGRIWAEAVGEDESQMLGWDAETGTLLYSVALRPLRKKPRPSDLEVLLPDPGADRLFYTTVSGEFGVFDVKTQERSVWSRRLGDSPGVRLSSDGVWLAVGPTDGDGWTEIWNTHTRTRTARFRAAASFHPLPGGTRAISTGGGRFRWWRIEPTRATLLGEHIERLGGGWFAYSQNGDYLSSDGVIPPELQVRGKDNRFSSPAPGRLRRLDAFPQAWLRP